MAKAVGKGSDVFADPVQSRYAGWVVVALLAFVAYLLRSATAAGAVTDIDALNFGLAAFRFDILEHQPHPPGYPGYVLFLKGIRILWPSATPLEIAAAGSQLAGIGVIAASYSITWRILQHRKPPPVFHALAASAFAAAHPILWFYGGDGQSHSAEALAILVLLRLALEARARRSALWLAGFGAAVGLAGAIRPTVVVLCLPLIGWVLWGCRAKQWAVTIGALAVVTASWYAGFMAWVGEPELYARATRAVVGELFLDNFSLLAGSAGGISSNIAVTALAACVAMIPLLAISRAGSGITRACAAILGAHVALFAVLFTAETGYFSGAAAIACLVPATWPATLTPTLRLRVAAAYATCLLFFWLAPASTPLDKGVPFPLPSFRFIADTGSSQALYLDSMCSAADGRPAILLTDNPTTTTNRWLPQACDGLFVAQHVHDLALRPDLDNWLIYRSRGLQAVPPPVPLEPGAPTTARLGAVELVLIAPESRPAWRRAVLAGSTCEPTIAHEHSPDKLPVMVLPRSCIPRVVVGAHVIELVP